MKRILIAVLLLLAAVAFGEELSKKDTEDTGLQMEIWVIDKTDTSREVYKMVDFAVDTEAREMANKYTEAEPQLYAEAEVIALLGQIIGADISGDTEIAMPVEALKKLAEKASMNVTWLEIYDISNFPDEKKCSALEALDAAASIPFMVKKKGFTGDSKRGYLRLMELYMVRYENMRPRDFLLTR